jgi:hypothetical protein
MNQIGHAGEFLDVTDAPRRYRTVVFDDQVERPAAEHAAAGVDLGDGSAHAQLDRLGRGAVVQAEFAVDPEQHRLWSGRLCQATGQGKTGKAAAQPLGADR